MTSKVEAYQATLIDCVLPDLEDCHRKFAELKLDPKIRVSKHDGRLRVITERILMMKTEVLGILKGEFSRRHTKLVKRHWKWNPFGKEGQKIKEQMGLVSKLFGLIDEVTDLATEYKKLNTPTPHKAVIKQIDALQLAITKAQNKIDGLRNPSQVTHRRGLEAFLAQAKSQMIQLKQELIESRPLNPVRPDPQLHMLPLSAAAIKQITIVRTETLRDSDPSIEEGYAEIKQAAYQDVKAYSKMDIVELKDELKELNDLQAILLSDLQELLLEIDLHPAKHPHEMNALTIIDDSREAVESRITSLEAQLKIRDDAQQAGRAKAERASAVETELENLNDRLDNLNIDLEWKKDMEKQSPGQYTAEIQNLEVQIRTTAALIDGLSA